MTTTPHVRLGNPDRTAAHRRGVSPDRGPRAAHPAPQRTVTEEQVEQAVRQLRERPGRPAAEQMQAVLRALDLTVVRSSEHRG